MATVKKGSAIYDDFGGVIFTPYEQGKPENVAWLLLKQITDNKNVSKLECTKTKIRATMTFERGDLGSLVGKFNRVTATFVTAMLKDKSVQKKYELAEKLKPCQVDAEEEKEAQEQEKEAEDGESEIPMFP